MAALLDKLAHFPIQRFAVARNPRGCLDYFMLVSMKAAKIIPKRTPAAETPALVIRRFHANPKNLTISKAEFWKPTVLCCKFELRYIP